MILLGVILLIIGLLTPIAIALLGYWLDSRARTETEKQTASIQEQARETADYEKVVDKRAQLWDKIALPLNDIYAYMLQVGHWKELTPAELIARKRTTDAIVYADRPYFSDQFFKAYNGFMDSVFATYGAVGRDAKVRTSLALQLKGDPARFTNEDNRAQIHASYYNLLDVVASELNLKIARPPVPRSQSQTAGGAEALPNSR